VALATGLGEFSFMSMKNFGGHSMNRRLGLLLVPVLIAVLAVSAFAQDIPKDKTNITISGSLDLKYVYYDDVMTFFNANYNTPNPTSTSFGICKYVVRFDAALAGGVDAVVTLENKTPHAYFSDFGNNGGVENNMDTYIGLAYINVKDFYLQNLNVKVGIQDLKFDWLNNGNPFFLDVRRAISPWSGNYSFTPFGINVNYVQKPVDWSTFAIVLNEQGQTVWDEAIYGTNLTYYIGDNVAALGKNSTVNVLLTDFVGPDKDQKVGTVGLGFNFVGIADVQGLDIFGEGYWQFGKVDTSIDAKGYAGQIGAKYTFAVDASPYIGAKYLYIRGDKDTTNDYEGFLSYENNNEYLVLNSNVGFGVEDSSYGLRLIGLSCGATIPVQKEQVLRPELLVGFAKYDKKDGYHEDDLGCEIDAKLAFDYTKNLTFEFICGYLFSSDVLKNYTSGYSWHDDKALAATLGANLKF